MKPRVLIVEDEIIIANHIKLALQSLGYEVFSVVMTGEEAVEHAQHDHPDVVLMDIELAGDIDGIETADQIRSRFNIPVVYLSAYSNKETLERAKITEPYGYILKPFNDRELYTNIEIALHKYQMEQRIVHLSSVLRAIRNINRLTTREKERQKLLQKSCEILIETRGYHAAWIALMDDSGKITDMAQAGIGDDFKVLIERSLAGDIPLCAKMALEQSDVVIIDNIELSWANCPIAERYKDDSAMCIRLALEDRVYGVLCVWLPPEFAGQEEEQDLFKEVAGDIAFALYSIELEEQRRRAEEELRKHREHLRDLVEERTIELQQQIIAREKFEKALRESEARFRMISELVSDYAYVLRVEPEGWLEWEWISDACIRITGYTPEEIDEHGGWMSIVHPDAKDIILRHRRAFLSGHESVCEYCIIAKSGDLFWLRDYSRPIWDKSRNQVIRIVGAAQDITERKRAEETVLLLKNAIETTDVGITITDVERKILYVNPAEARMHGYTVEDLIGQDVRIFSLDEYRQDIAFDQLEQHWERESVNIRRDGNTFPVHSISTPVRNNAGIPIGIITVSEDITERKRTEVELQQAKDAADAASRAKSEFLANISHELRTPLNAILGYAQILQEDKNLTERQHKGLETIRSSGEHLLTLINDILDLSKIEARRLELQEKEFHLFDFLENITNIIQIRAAQKGLAFTYEPDSNLPIGVRTDEKRLREVLINLLDNAIKYTKEGSVTFRVKRLTIDDWRLMIDEHGGSSETNKRKAKSEKRKVKILFEVEDQGIGIASEKLQEIFLPFQQVGGNRYATEGTGLGLAISYKLVQMMGGELYVASTVAKGSLFWFELQLPVVENGFTSKAKQARKIIGYKGERRTVLVADDDEHNRAVLLQMLLPLSFHVIEAENGQECVEKTLSHHPDLVLSDLRMPVMDGYEAARQIREYELRVTSCELRVEDESSENIEPAPRTPQHVPRTVIIAVSASVFEKSRNKAIEAGFDDFLIKPFQLENLLALLQVHLQMEWIYEEGSEESSAIASKTSCEPSIALSLPPEELEMLLTLASKSRIKPLLERLSQLEALDKSSRPFVEELRQLAKRYQTKEIVRCLQQIKEIQCVPLPPKETEALLELAKLGITRELLVKLDVIEHQDDAYAPLVKKLRRFTKEYQFDRMIELLQQIEQKTILR